MNDQPAIAPETPAADIAPTSNPLPSDIPTQQRIFVELRSHGTSFSKIAQQIGVSKKTLIGWSRKFQFEIQNLRAIELEQLQHELVSTRTARLRAYGFDLARIVQELRNRELESVSTSRLYSLADSFRRQILSETGKLRFSAPSREVPRGEYVETVQDWDV